MRGTVSFAPLIKNKRIKKTEKSFYFIEYFSYSQNSNIDKKILKKSSDILTASETRREVPIESEENS